MDPGSSDSAFADQGADLVDQVRARASDDMGGLEEGACVMGVLVQERTRVVFADAVVSKRIFILLPSAFARLEHVHLDARVEVHGAVAAGLDGTVDRVGMKLGDHGLDAVGHSRARHATERLHAQRHVRLLLGDVEHELGDLHVAFAATKLVVVEAVADAWRFHPCRAACDA